MIKFATMIGDTDIKKPNDRWLHVYGPVGIKFHGAQLMEICSRMIVIGQVLEAKGDRFLLVVRSEIMPEIGDTVRFIPGPTFRIKDVALHSYTLPSGPPETTIVRDLHLEHMHV